MKIKHRLTGLAAGLTVTLYGVGMMWRGMFEYRNLYSMTLYPPEVVATGVLVCFLSLLPSSWVEWVIRPKRKR